MQQGTSVYGVFHQVEVTVNFTIAASHVVLRVEWSNVAESVHNLTPDGHLVNGRSQLVPIDVHAGPKPSPPPAKQLQDCEE